MYCCTCVHESAARYLYEGGRGDVNASTRNPGVLPALLRSNAAIHKKGSQSLVLQKVVYAHYCALDFCFCAELEALDEALL